MEIKKSQLNLTTFQMGHTRGLNKLFYILFFLFQGGILWASFLGYEQVIEGISYFSAWVIIWCSFYTLVNVGLLAILTKNLNNKYFIIKVVCFALFSVLFMAAVIKEKLSYEGILSIVFLVFGFLAIILPDRAKQQ